MNMHVGVLTPTELAISERRAKFRQSIAEKAANLSRSKMEVAAEELIAAFRDAKVPEPESSPSDGQMALSCWFAPSEYASPYPSIEVIQRTVAKHYGVSRREILSPRRSERIVLPRQIACYLAKKLTIFSLPVIGHHFGHRDHTTILHAVRKIERLIAKDSKIASDVAFLTERLSET